MAKPAEVVESRANSLSLIEDIEIQAVQQTMQKILQFQTIIQKTLRQNHDYGIVPGTDKPTMLKPGAEKILMLLGLRSEFEIVDSTRDFEKGFFQYQVRCRLYKGDVLITEGLGSCNTKERKYIKQDPFTLDNTILKMAKKRALVDAALLVGSLSDIFTQDLEDMDLEGVPVQESIRQSKQATDTSGTITQRQAKRMFALAEGNAEIVRQAMDELGYKGKKSTDVLKVDYDNICARIEALMKEPEEEQEEQHDNEEQAEIEQYLQEQYQQEELL